MYYLINDIVAIFIVSVGLFLAIVYSLGIILLSKDTFITITDEVITWEGILSSSPSAIIPLHKVASIKVIENQFSEGGHSTEVSLILFSGDSLIIPIYDEDPYILVSSLREARPDIDFSKKVGRIEGEWRFILKAIFRFNTTGEAQKNQTNKMPNKM